jgi:putative flippase GtrA
MKGHQLLLKKSKQLTDLFFRYRGFLKFGLVGASNTIISLLVYYIVIFLGIHYQIANIAAFVISSLNGFILNRFWVFKSTTYSITGQILKYYVVYSGSLILSVVFSYVWIDVLSVNQYLAPLLNLFITIPFNYLLSKSWTFKKNV